MSSTPNARQPNEPQGGSRTDELLCDRAVFGLSDREHRELADQTYDAANFEAYERTAATYFLAAAPVEEATMPADLRSRVLGSAPAVIEKNRGGGELATKTLNQRTGVGSSRRRGFLPWAIGVAASLMIGIWLGRVATVVSAIPNPTAQLQALLEVDDVKRADWAAQDHPAAKGASGLVAWSDSEQEGYMVFKGLAPNDPTVEQYQLWVFDADRDDRYPVDGGVFNISADSPDVVVPIRTKLPVSNAAMFAITVERPGGVVVSDRKQLPLLAKIDAAG